MSAEDWRLEYLNNEIRDHRKRFEEATKLVKQAEEELNACKWNRDKAKAILDMLEVAYKVKEAKA